MHISIMAAFLNWKTHMGAKSTFISQTNFNILVNNSRYSNDISQKKLYYNNKIISIFLGEKISKRVIL